MLAREAARWSILLSDRPHEGMGAKNPEADLDAIACLVSVDTRGSG